MSPARHDPRYLRRKGNLRVRKARLARSLAGWTLIVALHGAVAALLIHASTRVIESLQANPRFALQRIEVQDCGDETARRLRTQLGPWTGRNLFRVSLRELELLVLADPWVRRIEVKRVLPSTLRLRVEEREPVALASIGGRAHLVDATGYVIGPAERGAWRGLPVLTGIPGRRAPELTHELRRGVRLLERLERAGEDFGRRILELDLAQRDRVVLRTVDPGPPLLLDPEIAERNVPQYLLLQQEIEHRVGPMDYVDLRWRDRITVKPASATPPPESR